MNDGTCRTCGARLDAAQDPGDDFPEVWCPAVRACEAAGCMVTTCGDDRPEPCAICALDHCPAHLRLVGDDRVCGRCANYDGPDMDEYTGPRGGEAAAELAHRQDIARRLK